jgi:phospholipid-binding lipoprotein MlaA
MRSASLGDTALYSNCLLQIDMVHRPTQTFRMPPAKLRWILNLTLATSATLVLTACAPARPRTDDPWEKFNRQTFAFNQTVDRIAIRPAAQTYRNVTPAPVRRSIGNFFTNIRLPVTVVNELLQGAPRDALVTSSRFAVNLTFGIAGFFDPASKMGVPLNDQDFSVTLAKWGVPDGPYLVVPLLGPTTARDILHFPVDSFYNPIQMYPAAQGDWYTYTPELLFLITKRTNQLDSDSVLANAYDPYVFVRDAYRQLMLHYIYAGDPPSDVIDQMQGINDAQAEKLLEEQQKVENKPAKQNPPSKH